MKGEPDQAGHIATHSADASTRYVWEAESVIPNSGTVAVTIGDLQVALDLQFRHERYYALQFLHDIRNPQADIDWQLFRAYVRPGDIVLDAGANIGVTAAQALACGATHVICVEPEAGLVNRLNALRFLAPERITVCHCALGARQGFADLLLSRTHNQGHTISPAMTALFPHLFDGHLQRVPVLTIDDILVGAASLIWKLDVEGGEADVIRGARRTLEHSPPRVVLAELYDPFVDEVVRLLSGYRVRRAALPKDNYALQLLDKIGGSLPNEYCPTSPTYAFTRSD